MPIISLKLAQPKSFLQEKATEPALALASPVTKALALCSLSPSNDILLCNAQGEKQSPEQVLTSKDSWFGWTVHEILQNSSGRQQLEDIFFHVQRNGKLTFIRIPNSSSEHLPCKKVKEIFLKVTELPQDANFISSESILRDCLKNKSIELSHVDFATNISLNKICVVVNSCIVCILTIASYCVVLERVIELYHGDVIDREAEQSTSLMAFTNYKHFLFIARNLNTCIDIFDLHYAVKIGYFNCPFDFDDKIDIKISMDGNHIAVLQQDKVYLCEISNLIKLSNIDILKDAVLAANEHENNIYSEDEDVMHEDSGSDEEQEDQVQLSSEISIQSMKSVSPFSRSYKINEQLTQKQVSQEWFSWTRFTTRDDSNGLNTWYSGNISCGFNGPKIELPLAVQLELGANVMLWRFWDEKLVFVGKKTTDSIFVFMHCNDIMNSIKVDGVLVLDDYCQQLYLWNNNGLHTILQDQTKDQTLNNIILFEKPGIARDLCMLNDWDQQALSIHVLYSGLRNRELEVIKSALSSIDKDLEMLVCCILAQFATSNVFPKSSEFKALFAKEALLFVSNVAERLNCTMKTLPFESLPSKHTYLLYEHGILGVELQGNTLIDQNKLDFSKWVQSFADKNATASAYEKQIILQEIIICLRDFLKERLDTNLSVADKIFSETENEQVNSSLPSKVSGDHDSDVESDSEIILSDDLIYLSDKQFSSDYDTIESLVSCGQTSLAFCLIRGRQSNILFENFKQICYKVIFKLFRAHKFEQAISVMNNLGEAPIHHLHELFYLTTDNAIRNYIAKNWKHFTERYKHQQRLLDKVQSKVNLPTKALKVYNNSIFAYGCIDDLGEPPAVLESRTDLFLSYRVIDEWDTFTRARIEFAYGDFNSQSEYDFDPIAASKVLYSNVMIGDLNKSDINTLKTLLQMTTVKNQQMSLFDMVLHLRSYREFFEITPLQNAAKACMISSFIPTCSALFNQPTKMQIEHLSLNMIQFAENTKLYQVVDSFMDIFQAWDKFQDSTNPRIQYAAKARSKNLSILAQLLYELAPQKTSLMRTISEYCLETENYIFNKEHYTLNTVFDRSTHRTLELTAHNGLIKFIEPHRASILTSELDISLKDMISDTYHEINIDYYFDKTNIEVEGMLVNFSSNIHGSYAETLDFEYYLTHNRPYSAYISLFPNSDAQSLFTSSSIVNIDKTGAVSSLAKIVDEQFIINLVSRVFELCFTESATICSCIVFLELCGVASEQLRTDFLVYTLISKKLQSLSDDKTDKKRLMTTILNVDKEPESKIVMQKYLQLLITYPDAEAWSAYCKFCKHHGFVVNLSKLIEYARSSEWNMLLHESQNLGLNYVELSNIVKENVPESALQEHIMLALEQPKALMAEQQSNDEVFADASHTLNIVLAGSKMYGEEAISFYISKAIKHLSSLLIVVAASMWSDKTPVSLFLYTWLWIMKKKLAGTSTTFTLPKYSSEEERSTLLKSLQEITVEICLSGNSSLLYALCVGWRIFDEHSPVLSFVQFFKQFMEHRYAEAEKHLRLFVVAAKNEDHSKCIGKFDWIVNLSKTLCSIMSKQLSTSYERTLFLRLIVESGYTFDTKYFRLHQINSIISCGEVEYPVLSCINVMEASPNEIISKFLACKKFGDARTIASLYGLPTAEITKEQALSIISTLQETPLWQYNQERYSAWNSIHALFQEHNYEQELSVLFFITQLKAYYTNISVEEIILLLTLSIDWCKGVLTIVQNETTKPKPCRSKTEIELLEHSVALLQKCVQMKSTQYHNHSRSLYVYSILSTIFEKFLGIKAVETLEQNSDKLGNISDFISAVVDSLLLESKLHEAEKLCQSFHLTIQNISTAKLAAELAKGKIKVQQIPKEILDIVATYANTDLALTNEDVQVTLDYLHYAGIGESAGYKHFCKLIALNYKISRALEISYDNIISKDDYEILKLMIMCGKEMNKLCSTFISLRGLKPTKAAQVCADFLFSQFCEYYIQQELTPNSPIATNEQQSTTPINTPQKRRSTKNDDYGSSSIEESLSSVESDFPIQKTMKRPSPLDLQVKIVSSTTLSPAGSEIVKASVDEFLEFASMLPNPSDLAYRLLYWIDEDVQIPPRATLKCRLELCIRAYWCFRISSNLEGIESLMKRIRESLVEQLIQQHEFGSLVDLIVSLRNYSELGFLFEILLKNEQFELILRKNTDKANQIQLNMILASYLQTKYPNDDDKLMMVYLRFNMYSNLGNWLMQKGKTEMSHVAEHLNMQAKLDEKTASVMEDKMSRAAQFFKSAADAFTKDECYQTATKCLTYCQLMELQKKLYKQTQIQIQQQSQSTSSSFYKRQSKTVPAISIPVVICLTKIEARQFMKSHEEFYDSLVVAILYDLNIMSEWIEPLYYHCISKNNMIYFVQFQQYLPTPPTLFREISKRFKTENQSSLTTNVQIQAMKSFLLYCTDFSTQLSIAKELGFRTMGPLEKQ